MRLQCSPITAVACTHGPPCFPEADHPQVPCRFRANDWEWEPRGQFHERGRHPWFSGALKLPALSHGTQTTAPGSDTAPALCTHVAAHLAVCLLTRGSERSPPPPENSGSPGLQHPQSYTQEVTCPHRSPRSWKLWLNDLCIVAPVS